MQNNNNRREPEKQVRRRPSMVNSPGIRRRSSRVYRKSGLKLDPRWIAGGAAALVLIIAVVVALVRSGNRSDTVVRATPAPAEELALTPIRDATPEPLAEAQETPVPAGPVQAAEAAPSEEPAAETAASEEVTAFELATQGDPQDTATENPFMPQDSVFASQGGETWKSSALAPEPEGSGYLPVFRRADTEEKVFAITVNDCSNAENLKAICQLAINAAGKLTLFPYGKAMKQEDIQETLRKAHSVGFEIENHTFAHAALQDKSDEDMAAQIYNFDRALDYVLGVKYTCHFFRPVDGEGVSDLRTHAYLSQIGYYGVASWSVSGTNTKIERLKEYLKPGEIYLFHTTDKDVTKLQELISYAVSQGYRLVTLNELFGYQKNAESALTDDPLTRAIPQLQAYQRDYKSMYNPTISYAVYEVQTKLIQLGFLEGKADGEYGTGTEAAVKAWQTSIGVTPDGILTPELQRQLLASTAAPQAATPAPAQETTQEAEATGDQAPEEGAGQEGEGGST